MFAFENFEKNAVFLFIPKQYLAIFGYFQKNRLHAYLLPFSNYVFSLDSWQGSQLTTNTKNVSHPCFAGKMFGRKMHCSTFEKI